MAEERIVKTKFWDDKYIRRLDTDGKCLFLYLFTNAKTSICGIYEIEIDRMCFDTAIAESKVRELLKKFQTDKKYIYKDGWIFAANFIKNQRPNPKILIGIRKALERAPRWSIDRLSKSPIYLNLNLNPNSNPNLNPDPVAETTGSVWQRPKLKDSSNSSPNLQSEVNTWLDAIAPVIGAKSRQTMSDAKRWRETVDTVVREQHSLPEFLKVIEDELDRTRGQPQFFTPGVCLKSLQTKKAKTSGSKFMHTL